MNRLALFSLSLSFLISILWSVTASAEQAIVNGVLDKELTKQQVTWDANNDTRGREYKAESGEGSGIAGGVIATATGGTLIGIGTRMLLSPELITRLAGADLVAKGTQELAQGIGDLASAGKNGGQKDLLLDAQGDLGDPLADQNGNGGETGDSAADPLAQIRQDTLTPDVREAFTSRGINPDNFFNQAASGNFPTAKDVLGFMGETESFGPEEVEQARIMVDERLSTLFNERDKVSDLGGLKPSGSKSSSSEDLPGAGEEELSAQGASKHDSGNDVAASTSGALNEPDQSGLEGLLGALGEDQAKKEDGPNLALQIELRKQGIRRKKDSIFTIARRNFKKFNDWRSGMPVATPKPDKTAMLMPK